MRFGEVTCDESNLEECGDYTLLLQKGQISVVTFSSRGFFGLLFGVSAFLHVRAHKKQAERARDRQHGGCMLQASPIWNTLPRIWVTCPLARNHSLAAALTE